MYISPQHLIIYLYKFVSPQHFFFIIFFILHLLNTDCYDGVARIFGLVEIYMSLISFTKRIVCVVKINDFFFQNKIGHVIF